MLHVVSLNIIYCFSLATFKIFSLSLEFISLTMMCLGMVFFVIILYGDCCLLDLHVHVLFCFFNFVSFSHYVSKVFLLLIFLIHFQVSPSGTSTPHILDLFILSHSLRDSIHFPLIFCFPLIVSKLITSIALSSSLLTVFFLLSLICC